MEDKNCKSDEVKKNLDRVREKMKAPDYKKKLQEAKKLQELKECLLIGRLLGYPKCCRKFFCSHDVSEFTEAQLEIRSKGHSEGFIPCPMHSLEVISGKRTLASLIVNRDPRIKKPFPEIDHNEILTMVRKGDLD